MRPDANVVSLLSNVFGEVLVDGNAACFEGFRGNLLLLVAYEMGYVGKEIDCCSFVADVVNPDLGFGDTTTVPTLDVGLVLLVTVTTSWTATHDWY